MDSTSSPVPARGGEALTHADIDALGRSEKMTAALHLVLDGTPCREAARSAGLASHQDVYRAAKQLEIVRAESPRLVGGFRRIVDLTNEELERRLVEQPEEISTKDLAVVGGIASDKLAKYEGWGSSTRDPAAAASAFVDRLAALEGKVTLNVTYERTKSDAPPRPIDVTPSKTAR